MLSAVGAENRALKLDLEGGFVELPSDIFKDLDEATVECWVNWADYGYFCEVFGFGVADQMFGLNYSGHTQDLQFFIYDRTTALHLVSVPNILRWDEWSHVAAVSGPSGMKLYFNGVLVGENPYTGSFSAIENSENNYLGGQRWEQNTFFDGLLDEVRVWNSERSQEEIEQNMFRQADGTESGLIGLWNFESGDARDQSSQRNHGSMRGNARSVVASLPELESLVQPIVVKGLVTDKTVQPMSETRVRIERSGRVYASTLTDGEGRFEMVILDKPGRYDFFLEQPGKGLRHLGEELRIGKQNLNLKWAERGVISGTLIDFESAPQPGVVIEARLGNAVVAYTTSLQTGDYVLSVPEAGAFTIVCRAPRAALSSEVQVFSNRSKPYSVNAPVAVNLNHGQVISGLNFQFSLDKGGNWKSFSSFDGLGSNIIKDMHEADDGTLWIGTLGGGVSRFFGGLEKSLAIEDGLQSNEIGVMELDAEGNLWIALDRGGLARFDGREIVHFTIKDGLPDEWIRSIHSDRAGTIWVGTDKGIASFAEGRFTPIKALTGILASRIHHAVDGSYWFASYGVGVYQYDGQRINHFAFSDGLAGNDVSEIAESANGDLWFGTSNGLSRWNGTRFKNFHQEHGLPANGISDLFLDRDEVLWIATNRGVSRFDGAHFLNFSERDGLANDYVTSVLRDSHGYVWVGTHEGLSRYDDRWIVSYTQASGLAGGPVVSVFCDPEDYLWAGGFLEDRQSEGLSRFDGTEFTRFTTRDGLAVHNILSFANGEDGAIWVGTDSSEISLMRGDQIVETRSRGVEGLANVIVFTETGEQWVGTNWGPVGYDQEKGEFSLLPGFTELQSTYDIFKASDGRYWFATGVGVFASDGEKLTKYNEESGLAYDIVHAICESADGALWFGTENGASRYHNGVWQTYSSKDGLAHSRIYDIHQTHDGVLVFATANGISQFDGIAWSSLDSRDGMAGNEIRGISENSKGDLWFACHSSGISRYRRNTIASTVLVDSVNFGTQSLSPEDARPITSGTRVTFHFRASDRKTLPGKHLFRSRIVRISGDALTETDHNKSLALEHGWKTSTGDWDAPSQDTSFEWIADDPGNYLYQVQAIDRDLNYSVPASILLSVIPPWYLNGIIVIPSGAGLVALIFFAASSWARFNGQRRETIRLQEHIFQEEKKARESLEVKNSELQNLNGQLQIAKEEAETASEAKSSFFGEHVSRNSYTDERGYRCEYSAPGIVIECGAAATPAHYRFEWNGPSVFDR